MIACPLCDSASRAVFEVNGYPIQDCIRCGHRFVGVSPRSDHVETIYGDDYFQGGGAGYPDYLAEGKLLRETGQRYGRLLSRFARPGLLLDVGAAAGFLLQGFQHVGWKGQGIEPNARMAAYAREQLGVEVFPGTLDTFDSPNLFDAISFIQVLAHFPDPMTAFRLADRLTKPGGVWLIETWNAASRMAQILGKDWHEYSPPSVLHLWSPQVLKRTLNSLGYRLRSTGIAQKWIGVGHAKSLLQHKYGNGVPTKLAGMIPSNWKLPYPSEDLFWAVYQKV